MKKPTNAEKMNAAIAYVAHAEPNGWRLSRGLVDALTSKRALTSAEDRELRKLLSREIDEGPADQGARLRAGTALLRARAGMVIEMIERGDQGLGWGRFLNQLRVVEAIAA